MSETMPMQLMQWSNMHNITSLNSDRITQITSNCTSISGKPVC